MLNYPDYLFNMNKDFFSQDLGDNKKIFILGSSHIYPIDPDVITEHLEESDYRFDVYNLGIASDDFEERERTLDMILAKKPEIVMYGIEPRAFETSGRTISQTSESPLFHVGSIGELFDSLDLGDKKGVFKNPKFALIRSLSPVEEIQSNPYSNSPFFRYMPDVAKIAAHNELNDIKIVYKKQILPVEKNSSLYVLDNMINKLEKNYIKVIIFVTPHSKFYLETYPENQARIFQQILDNISEKHEIMIFSLYDNYADLNVWNNHTHLAANENTNFYSKDIADFIINKLER